MKAATLDKIIGFTAVAAILVAGYVASEGFDTTSSTRRGRGLESLTTGYGVIFGNQDPQTPGLEWAGRGILLVAIILVGVYFWRRSNRKTKF